MSISLDFDVPAGTTREGAPVIAFARVDTPGAISQVPLVGICTPEDDSWIGPGGWCLSKVAGDSRFGYMLYLRRGIRDGID